MSKQPIRMSQRGLLPTHRATCEVCGRPRGGTRPVNHAKCSKIRQQRGFPEGIAQEPKPC